MDHLNFFQKYSQTKSNLIWGSPSSKNPLLTVFVPTYKRADLLLQSIESLLKCPEDFLIVILDNNPERNDAAEQMLTTHFVDNERICYYKNEKNIGMFGNWNRCFELCKTPWLYMLHDDDLIYPDGISILLETIKKNIDTAVITFQSQPFWHDEKISFPTYRGRKAETLLYPCYIFAGNKMNPSATCFNVSKGKQAGGFDEKFFPSSDYEYCARILRAGEKVIASHQVIALRRIGNNESSNYDTIHKFVMQDDKLLQEHLSLFKNRYIRSLLEICKNGYLRNYIRVLNRKLPEEKKINEMKASFFEKSIYFVYCWTLIFIFRENLRLKHYE